MWRTQSPTGKIRGGAGMARGTHLPQAWSPGGGEPGVWHSESGRCPLPPQASQQEDELPRRARRRGELQQYESRYLSPLRVGLGRATAAAAPAYPPLPMFMRWLGQLRGRSGGREMPRIVWLLLAVGLLFSGLVFYIYLGLLPPLPWASSRPLVSPHQVTVLMWWEPFSGSGRSSGPAPDCQRQFNVSGCRLITDRKYYWEAQAVLFHHRDLVGTQDWPPPRPEPNGIAARVVGISWMGSQPARPPGQRWVWMNFESPTNSPKLGSFDSSLFNWTLTYRADSDIFVPYGYLYPRNSLHDPPAGLMPPMSRKQGLVAWVISHWNEKQARVRYYYELRRHVKVDVFGLRGPGRLMPDIGLLHTVARYKFYLAFENSQHQDYITEKLWRNSLLAGAVPVVLGPSRANYERFVPRSAFIHVDDFPNASALAAYLHFLDRNLNMYKRYFDWRRRYAVHTLSFWDEPWCRTCQVLQIAGDRPKKMYNLAAWFQR
ncbi:alpha-(1,3)-fucosyltransferase 4 [Monodelphis domestica]|nr:alpha-(1,3)-fucosyltransferase 4 [Monodelphis domestica]